MKAVRLPAALIDLVEMADFLANEDVVLADRFFEAFEETVEIIERNPKIGSLHISRSAVEVRMWFVKDFEKCLIFYSEHASEVVILRLIHASRDYTRFI